MHPSRLLCLMLLSVAGRSVAAEPAKDAPLAACLRCLVCPDDYARKPLPCLPHAPCGGLCDDYCKKPLPCVPCAVPGVFCDDYCKKPVPCPPGPDWSRWLKCPPACAGKSKLGQSKP